MQFAPIAPRTYLLQMQTSSSVQCLLLCFQEPFLRFHLTAIPYSLHQDAFSQRINKTIAGASLKSIDLLNDDRILNITFQKGKALFHLVSEFFPKRPNFYFADNQMSIIEFLNPVTAVSYVPPSNTFLRPDEAPKVTDSASIERNYADKEKEHAFSQERNILTQEIAKRLKRFELQKEKCLHDLEFYRQWETVHHDGILLQANLYRLKKGMKEIMVQDWLTNEDKVIALEPMRDPQEEIVLRFNKSKKMRLGIPHLEKRLASIEEMSANYHHLLTLLPDISTSEEILDLKKGLALQMKSKIGKYGN